MYTITTSKVSASIISGFHPHSHTPDQYDKNWTSNNYLSRSALMQADNVREQLKRTMERFKVELVSVQDQKMFLAIRQALCCGFFMQVAHKDGEGGNYMTMKDDQVRPSGFGWRKEVGC
jgi:pre-mRNA-splicing factor ATP-dependent RNA helicase DHX15/PRP43